MQRNAFHVRHAQPSHRHGRKGDYAIRGKLGHIYVDGAAFATARSEELIEL
jgi:hypothetical protein